MKYIKAKTYVNELYKKHSINSQSEVEWLFCAVLKVDRAKLYQIDKLSYVQFLKVKRLATKRVKGAPLAKLIKNWEFYGLEFYVNKNVLTPRAETENLVEQVINDFHGTNNKNILDLCTGSGIIAITLKKHLKAKITASDISKKALRVAKKNAKNNKVNINFVHSNLFNNIEGKFSAIISNPPYIKSCDINNLQKEVKNYDPHLALDGGVDGLKFYKEIIKKAYSKLNKNGKLYLEIGYNQKEEIVNLFNNKWKDVKVIKDYNKIDRIIIASKE